MLISQIWKIPNLGYHHEEISPFFGKRPWVNSAYVLNHPPCLSLQSNQSLRVISLAYNGFDNQGAVALADAFKVNSTLEELDIRLADLVLASIPGRTEDGPGIDCLRMRHIIPRNWGLRITSYYAQ